MYLDWAAEYLCEFCDAPRRDPSKQRGRYCSPSCRRSAQYLRAVAQRYGLTLGAYKRMYEEQGSRCAICRSDFGPIRASELTAFVVHDHKTGGVRSLLCRRCNTALGFLGDDPELLDRAAAYLRRFNAPSPAP